MRAQTRTSPRRQAAVMEIDEHLKYTRPPQLPTTPQSISRLGGDTHCRCVFGVSRRRSARKPKVESRGTDARAEINIRGKTLRGFLSATEVLAVRPAACSEGGPARGAPARQPGSQAARQPGSQAARQPGSQAARQSSSGYFPQEGAPK